MPARPIYLQANEEPVFALFHDAAQGGPEVTAVLICPPFGWDEICSYRARRDWAEHLAAGRHPTLRIDFPGSGDSGGSPRDPGRIMAWTSALSSAASWLRAETECSRVAAIGLGLGGLMACKAMADGASIDELILWAVPARGATFLREIRTFARMEDSAAADTDAQRAALLPEGFIWAGGFVLSAETLAALEQLDLTELALTSPRSHRRALLLERDGIAPDRRLKDYLENQAIEVTVAAGPGYGAMGPKPHLARPPLEVFSCVLEWLEHEPVRSASELVGPPDSQNSSPRRPDPAPTGADAVELTVGGSVIRETPLEIAQPFGNLFGILAEPSASHSVGPCLLMLNAGAVRRVGPNRMWVEICRRWAAEGISTMRLDIEGVGDSDGDAERITRLYPSVMYTDERVRQVLAVIDTLQDRGVSNSFILAGLCSGGYWSFHCADRDDRVSAAFLVNPRMLFWDRLIETERDNRRRVLRASVWPRVLRGKVPASRVISLARQGLFTLPRQLLAGQQARRSRADKLDRAFDRLRANDKNIQFFFSGDEPLREELEQEGRLSELDRWPNVKVHYLPGTVHTLRPFA
ncbi:MAG TPA: hypothetical protein VKG38_04860, partial [Solirubrobacteraceae bacterium]|nr:hypothetical protein [Solirubrobacteraceae bacterium]